MSDQEIKPRPQMDAELKFGTNLVPDQVPTLAQPVTREEFDRISAQVADMPSDANTARRMNELWSAIHSLTSKVGGLTVIQNFNWSKMGTVLSRLDKLEQESYLGLRDQYLQTKSDVMALENQVNGNLSDDGKHGAVGLADRLAALESAVTGMPPKSAGDHSSLSERLAALESAQVPNAVSRAKVDKAQLDLINALTERLTAVERRLSTLTVAWNNSSATARPSVGFPDGGALIAVEQPVAPQPAASSPVSYSFGYHVKLKNGEQIPDGEKVTVYHTSVPVVLAQPAACDLTAQWCFDPACKETGAHYAHPVKPAAPAKRITPEQLQQLAIYVSKDSGMTVRVFHIAETVPNPDQPVDGWEILAARINDFFGGK